MWLLFTDMDNKVRELHIDDNGDGVADELYYFSYLPLRVAAATFDTDGDGLHDLGVLFNSNGTWLRSEHIEAPMGPSR
jgi:hypothetical protein